MTYEDILNQAVAMLQRQGRLTYQSLQLQFHLDDTYLEVLKGQLLYAYPQTVINDDQGVIWTGDSPEPASTVQDGTDTETRFQTLLLVVIELLQRERRITYRTLKHRLGVDETLLTEIREELRLTRLAIDEEGKVLVWMGEPQSPALTAAVAPSQPAIAETTVVPSAALPAPSTLVTLTPTETNGPTASSEDSTTEVLPAGSGVAPEPTRLVPEAERRQLTVMFCDLVGATDLSGKLDPEDLREVVRAYQESAATVIERYEGHIAQYLGDGLLVYFGYPVAHEDDAQRAVYTGLEIPDAIATLNTRLEVNHGVQLAVRIGIHTGPVVVGEMGGGGRHETLALGETPNIAARLEGLAQPNSAVVSSVTAQLLQRSFVLEALGPHALKGVAEPMQVSRVIGAAAVHQDEDESMPDGGVFLVGRDEEIGLLLRRWEQSKEGLGQAVLISGEPGIGKSSLVSTMRQHVVKERRTRITFRCSPYHTNSALYPVIDHLQRILQFQPGDTPETRLDQLERVLIGYSRPLDEVVPLLAALLSVPVPEERYPVLNVSPQQQRQQTQDALVGWLLEEAERQPILAIWEDLHWADPSTLEILGLALEQAPTVPMLHVLTFRPEFEPPWPTRSHLTPITLNRLERPHVEGLIAHLVGGKALPDEVILHVVAKTDGVPLYVEELTKMLLESGLLREEAEHYVLTGPLMSVAIPDTLQDSLMARLDQLGPAKEVAQFGAVLGREFPFEMLQAIASQDEETVQVNLSRLVDAELLYQRGRPPRATYIFKHALIQDAAYASLLKSTRQQVHNQITQLLESRFPELVETQPELLAHHCTEAGQDEAAISYWQRAGQYAIQCSAYVEAVAHLAKGLALLATLPQTPEHLRQELDLQVALGPAFIATKGYAVPDVERVYTRARELCEQVGDTLQLFSVMRGLMVYYQVKGQLQTAAQLGEQLLSLAHSRPESGRLMLAHYQLGMVLYFQGKPAFAQPLFTQPLAMYCQQEHRALALRYGIDLGVASGSFLAWDLWQLGYPDQALRHIQEARMLAQEVSHSYSLAIALALMAVLHQYRRETLAAQAQGEAATSLTTDQGFVSLWAWGKVVEGWALAMQGQSEAGIAEIHKGLDNDLATGAKTFLPYYLGLLAEAYGESGRPEDGLKALAEALAVIDDTEARFHEAEIYRLKGELLLQHSCDSAPEVESCFQQAVDVAREQQAKSWELRAATSLARLWQSQGKRTEARELLGDVYGWFTEGFDTADLQDAKALLVELDG